VQPALAFRSVVFKDTNDKLEATTTFTSSSSYLSSTGNLTTQCLRQQSCDWNQSTEVNSQTPRLFRAASACDGKENDFDLCIEPNQTPSLNTLTNSLLVDLDATLKWDVAMLSMETPHVHIAKRDGHSFESEDHIREGSDTATVSISSDRAHLNPILKTLFETMPATQEYSITTSYLNT
jgi:hypothetical protein